jgi:hypothetical protein
MKRRERRLRSVFTLNMNLEEDGTWLEGGAGDECEDIWHANYVDQVLNSRLEKTRILNTKLSACLGRLETSGKSVKEAVGPLYGNTQKLQVLGNSMSITLLLSFS